MKLLVRSLSRETRLAELLVLFQVQYRKLAMDRARKNSRVFGFVEMPRSGGTQRAIRGLDARKVGGSRIRVKQAQARGYDGAGTAPVTAGP